uniref:Uncharacterized protein n=1 Tax=Aegilops tauschii subsp. strangulata TaxID=200361 RepID=A0A452XUQ4_AEGTS
MCSAFLIPRAPLQGRTKPFLDLSPSSFIFRALLLHWADCWCRGCWVYPGGSEMAMDGRSISPSRKDRCFFPSPSKTLVCPHPPLPGVRFSFLRFFMGR